MKLPEFKLNVPNVPKLIGKGVGKAIKTIVEIPQDVYSGVKEGYTTKG